jgi:hypothetical protein
VMMAISAVGPIHSKYGPRTPARHAGYGNSRTAIAG